MAQRETLCFLVSQPQSELARDVHSRSAYEHELQDTQHKSHPGYHQWKISNVESERGQVVRTRDC